MESWYGRHQWSYRGRRACCSRSCQNVRKNVLNRFQFEYCSKSWIEPSRAYQHWIQSIARSLKANRKSLFDRYCRSRGGCCKYKSDQTRTLNRALNATLTESSSVSPYQKIDSLNFRNYSKLGNMLEKIISASESVSFPTIFPRVSVVLMINIFKLPISPSKRRNLPL